MLQLSSMLAQAHQHDKDVVVHIDLMSGIGKDRAGIQYLHELDLDGIITSGSQLVAALRQHPPGPFIAGGFIRTAGDVARVQAAGALLSSSRTYELWKEQGHDAPFASSM